MLEFETDSDSSSQYRQTTQPTKSAISVLRHLVEARKIMQGQNYEHQITKCVYQQPLASNPGFVAPRPSNTQSVPLASNKLSSLQDALYEHEQLRQRVKNVLQKDSSSTPQTRDTLWNLYSSMVPSYSRFAACPRKSNFANVLLPINGVNIQLGSKWADKAIPKDNRNALLTLDTLRFDSHFQSGNLAYVYRKQCTEVETYDLILQNDTNTKGHNQWFYFKVYNSKRHNRVRFNIINFIKDESMFSYGIKPLIFSQRDFSKHRIGWVRDGDKVAYFQNKIKRECNSKNYHTLTFEYCFREIDAVYFAPTHPYTYSQLTQYVQSLMPQLLLSNFFSLKTAVETVGGNSINVLTFSTGKKQIQQCNIAWIIARQHPGETTSSYIIQGIINYLISLFSSPPSEYSNVVDSLMFKIVPMLNVDGVVHGNTRAELTGVDPNRIWKKTVKRLSPGVGIIKKLILQTKQNVKLFLDLHSHSKKVGCFFYGNSLLHDPKRTRVYPTMVCNNDEKFELKHCRFRGGYDTTARSVLFHEMGIQQVFTVECSLLGYMKKNRIVEYKIPDYHQIGKKLILCHIQLEKTKMVKAEKQIIADLSHLIIDKDDIDSARSESSLSGQQYEEIRHKIKHKKRKIKRSQNQNPKPQQNETIDHLKYFVKKNMRANTKIETSINEKKKQSHSREMSANQLRSKFNILNIKNSNKEGQESNKKGGTIGMKELVSIPKLNPNRKLVERDLTEERKSTLNHSKANIIRQLSNKLNQQDLDGVGRLPTKQTGIQASFQDDRYVEQKKSNKLKSEQLCVVGSSLEDELIFVSKNQIGIQISQQIIDQSVIAAENVKKSSKIKKAPKILNYLCSNLIGATQQNSIFPQDRRLAPLIYKKNTTTTKI